MYIPIRKTKILRKQVGITTLIVVVALASILTIYDEASWRFGRWPYSDNDYSYNTAYTDQYDSYCNVALIPVQWEILTYLPREDVDDDGTPFGDSVSAEHITKLIRQASADSSIDAIIMQIDSPGGSWVGSEEIQTALKRSPKYTVALIRDMAASAWYAVALWADKIVASRQSEIGSIGISLGIMIILNNTKMKG
jgi:ClpP class serine protease